jgi:hypothetical protein
MVLHRPAPANADIKYEHRLSFGIATKRYDVLRSQA